MKFICCLISILILPVMAVTESLTYSEEAFVSYVEKQVQQECSTCRAKVHFDQVIEGSTDKLVKKISIDQLKGKTVIRLQVKGSSEGGEVKVEALPIHIRWIDKVVVAKKNIRHGHVMTKSDLHIVEKDITFNQVPYLIDIQRAVGMIGKRSFIRGQIIDDNSLKRPRVVRYGQPLKLHFVQGYLSMVVNAKARGAGAVGDMIPVLIPKTKKKVMAKIVDKHSVRME